VEEEEVVCCRLYIPISVTSEDVVMGPVIFLVCPTFASGAVTHLGITFEHEDGKAQRKRSGTLAPKDKGDLSHDRPEKRWTTG
jgi:hypothetical protein